MLGTVRLFALSAIPRGANGKIQRGRLRSVITGMTAGGQKT